VTIKPGATVRSSESAALVTINQLRPIGVDFNVPERHLAALRKAMAAGAVTVTAAVREQPDELARGTLSFIDAQVDRASGTILAKAQFPNSDTRLWPGAFTDVTVTLRVDPHAIAVPDVAVQTGQDGRYVFVVGPGNKAEVRPVTVARIQDGLTVVARGLQAGERVVVEGQSRLSEGALIRERSDKTKPVGVSAEGGPA